MEYSIEYSKKNAKQSKYWKFWNMEYSRNIKKNKTGHGGVKFNQAYY